MNLKIVSKDESKIVHLTDTGEYIITELMQVSCPECGQLTNLVVTAEEFTYYGHKNPGETLQLYCVVRRDRQFIPDELLYVQAVQGDNDNVSVSQSVLGAW